MVRITLFFAITILCLVSLSAQTTPQQEGIYLILDASGSMWGRLADNSYKIETAKKVLLDFVGSDFDGKQLAIRVYGHRQKGDCRDSELLIPFGSPEEVAAALKNKINKIKPVGKTPISYSFKQALSDFGDRPGRIVLISDGIETCDEDPCALMREWKEKNIEIAVHVVGLGLEEKEKTALECISEVADTKFKDAESAQDLIEVLEEVKSKPPVTSVFAALNIKGQDAEGNQHKIDGELYQNGEKVQVISSEGNHQVPAGTYTIKAGIRTRNGTLYAPVEKEVEVAAVGRTNVDFTISVPARLSTTFLREEEKVRGGHVYVFQNGEEKFHFRWMDEVYIDEGEYEIRSKADDFNELSQTVEIKAGERKEVTFDLRPIIRVYVHMFASGSKTQFRKNLDLHQDGEKIASAHIGNGAKIPPGKYDVWMYDELGDYVAKGIELSEEDRKYEITIPCGHVTFEYQKPDGSRDKDDRMWLGRDGSNRTKYVTSGTQIPLQPGNYKIEGWSRKGQYDPVLFTIEEGQEKKIVLRAK